jgi:hypothetical protein
MVSKDLVSTHTHIFHQFCSFVLFHHSKTGDSKALYQFSIAVLILSSFFWVWALINTITGDFDFGVVSFLLVMCTSSYGIRLATTAQGEQPSLLLAKSLTIGSHLLVALNYLLGSVLGFAELDRPGFGAYCAVFVVVWVGIAYRAFVLMKQQQPSTGDVESAECKDTIDK